MIPPVNQYPAGEPEEPGAHHKAPVWVTYRPGLDDGDGHTSPEPFASCAGGVSRADSETVGA